MGLLDILLRSCSLRFGKLFDPRQVFRVMLFVPRQQIANLREQFFSPIGSSHDVPQYLTEQVVWSTLAIILNGRLSLA